LFFYSELRWKWNGKYLFKKTEKVNELEGKRFMAKYHVSNKLTVEAVELAKP